MAVSSVDERSRSTNGDGRERDSTLPVVIVVLKQDASVVNMLACVRRYFGVPLVQTARTPPSSSEHSPVALSIVWIVLELALW